MASIVISGMVDRYMAGIGLAGLSTMQGLFIMKVRDSSGRKKEDQQVQGQKQSNPASES